MDFVLSSLCSVGLSVLANILTPTSHVRERMDKCYEKALKLAYPNWSTDEYSFHQYKNLDALSQFLSGDISRLTSEHLHIFPFWIELMKDDEICAEYVRDVENKGYLNQINLEIKGITNRLIGKIDDSAHQANEHHEEVIKKIDEILEGTKKGWDLHYNIENHYFSVGPIVIHDDDCPYNIITNQHFLFLVERYRQESDIWMKKKWNDLIDTELLNIIKTAGVFEIGSNYTSSQMWLDAKAKFEEGDFKGADDTLSEKFIEVEEKKVLSKLGQAHEKLVTIASEWYTKAKTVMSNNSIEIPERLVFAYKYYDNSINILKKVPCSESILQTRSEYMFDFADLARQNNNFKLAEDKYKETLLLLRKLFSVYKVYLPLWEPCLNNLANIHIDIGKYEDAEREYKAVLKFCRLFSQERPDVYAPNLASVLNNFAILHHDTGRYEEAKKEHEEALTIRRSLVKKDSERYISDLASTLNNLAILHRDSGKYDEAEKEYIEALSIYRELTIKEPDSFRPYLASSLSNLAHFYKDMRKYDNAETELNEALTIYRLLAENNPIKYSSGLAMCLNNLAIIHEHTQKIEAARTEFIESLSIYRFLVEINPDVYSPDLAMSLNVIATYHRENGNYEDAEKELKESLFIYRSFAERNPKIYNKYLATTLESMAILHKLLGRFTEMEEENKEALELKNATS